MAQCDFHPTNKRTPQGRLIWKCAACGMGCCGDTPTNATCRAYPRDVKIERKQAAVEPCQYRGELLGSINCGCGSVNRETEVFKCELFTACTLTSLGGKAGWLKLGIRKRPMCCRCCFQTLRDLAIAEREERTP
jgi:hypothetical protein